MVSHELRVPLTLYQRGQWGFIGFVEGRGEGAPRREGYWRSRIANADAFVDQRYSWTSKRFRRDVWIRDGTADLSVG